MSTRGEILPGWTDRDVVERAVKHGLRQSFIEYSMEPGRNGGNIPKAPDCGSRWWDAKAGRTRITSDCIGFAMWCSGLDRYQPKLFKPQGGWINTDGILADVAKTEDWDMFRQLHVPKPGCLVVYGDEKKIGHVGVVTEVNFPEAHFDAGGRLAKPLWKKVVVVHCHGPALKGPAISATTAALFEKKADSIFVEVKR